MSDAPHNILRHFRAQAQRVPSRPALRYREEALTFGALWREVEALAADYARRGIGPGHRVLVFVPMSVDLYRAVPALLYLGAVPVFLDQWASFSRLRHAARLADCHGAILTPKLRWVAWAIPELRRLRVRLSPKRVGGPRDVLAKAGPYEVAPEDSALVTFTTGSTGVPKAADRSHALLDAQLAALRPLLHPEEELVDATLLPIVLLLNLAIGRTSLIPDVDFRRPARFDPAALERELLRHGVTSLTGSPHYCIELARAADPALRLQLRRLICGGAPVFPDQAAVIDAGLPHTQATVVYGSTEAEPISHVGVRELARYSHQDELPEGLPVGEVDAGARVAVVPYREGPWPRLSGEAFAAARLPEGTVGELVVTGAHVLARYFRNEEGLRQNKLYVDGVVWHRTGDAGAVRGGRVWLYGRCGATVRVAGRAYYPFLIEYALRRLAGVATGTLVQVDDGPVLAYVPEDGYDVTAVAARVREWGAGRGRGAARLVQPAALPLDVRHHGKVDYGRLRGVVGAAR